MAHDLRPAWWLFLAAAIGGCAAPASISSWQRNVERYVADNGDPNALRDVTLDGDRRGFAVIGNHDPKKATDARGVLLAHQAIENQPWFIYLVGLVKHEKVEDIRLAAVSFAGPQAEWRISDVNQKSLTEYRHHSEQLWKQKHPDRTKPPPEYTTFPRAADRFDASVQGTLIQAIHSASGARWSLDLNHPKR